MELDHPHYRWREIESCWSEQYRCKTAVYFHGKPSEPYRHTYSDSEPAWFSAALDSETRTPLGSLFWLGDVAAKHITVDRSDRMDALGSLKKAKERMKSGI